MAYASTLTSAAKTGAPPWRWAFAGAVTGLLLTLVLAAPARWLAALVEQAGNGHVQLAAPRGTVWQGSAQLVLSGGAGSRDAVVLPGHVEWRIRPVWGGLAVRLGATCCTAEPLRLQILPVGWGGVQLSLADGQSSWPAGLLAGLGTPWNTVQAQGQLVADTRGLAARWANDQLRLTGNLQLDARQISSRLSTLQPMGSYRLVLQGGEPAGVTLTTLDGSLQLAGQGQWSAQGLRFDGTASAAPGSVDALSNLLNILGRRNGASSIIKVG